MKLSKLGLYPPKPRYVRRLEKGLKRILVGFAVAVIPRLYLAYLWLVWKTSRIESFGPDPHQFRERYGKGVFVLWHDEVFTVAWAYGRFHGSTLASRGDFGEVITRILQLCNFEVFRGGSSSGRRRRLVRIVDDMVAHMKSQPGVVYGITTDGSAGPRYQMKHGAVHIATRCDAPLGVARTACRRYFRLKTWDRTMIPLPFNHIVHLYAGPFWAPPEAKQDNEALESFAGKVEEALLEITWMARTRIEGPSAPNLLESYPVGWKPPTEPLVLDRDEGFTARAD